jgi:hypothetical protein
MVVFSKINLKGNFQQRRKGWHPETMPGSEIA